MLPPPLHLTTLAFDADDTLWENEVYFRHTEEELATWLADFADRPTILAKLLENGKTNVRSHGFGMKTFTFSMIDTAIDVSGGKVSANVIARILAAGKEMLNHPVELLPDVRDTLERLALSYRLVLVTKGDLFHQEIKVQRSGLQGLFEGIEIVSDKNAATYHRIFARHGEGPEHGMMIGNSLKSDIIPAIEAGSWGVYIPHELTWAFEHSEPPDREPRYREIKAVSGLEALLEQIKG